MKKWQIILVITIISLIMGCKEDDNNNNPVRPKSPYINRFLGEYDIAERYVIDKENFVDDSIYIDTLMDTTYNYKLRIEESKYECFDICFNAIDAFHFSAPIHATIIDDSTFFFSQQIPAVPSYGYINGKGTVSQNTTTIKMNYTKSGPNQYGEQHHYNVTGTRYK